METTPPVQTLEEAVTLCPVEVGTYRGLLPKSAGRTFGINTPPWRKHSCLYPLRRAGTGTYLQARGYFRLSIFLDFLSY